MRSATRKSKGFDQVAKKYPPSAFKLLVTPPPFAFYFSWSRRKVADKVAVVSVGKWKDSQDVPEVLELFSSEGMLPL